MRAATLSLPFVMALALAACGPAQPEPVTPAPGVAQAPAAPAVPAAPAAPAAPTAPAAPAAVPVAPVPATVAFSSMTKEQKLNHMKTVILPRMGKLFQGYDGKKYGDPGCATCHGPNKQDPHVVLPALVLSGDGFQKLMAAKPAVMKFMTEQVVGQMATAMGEKPFDPATKQGFGCGGCHTVK